MDWDHIKLAKQRRDEIKAEISKLQEEDKQIVEWLDCELVINQCDNKTQKFEGPGVVVKGKVPQNFKVNNDIFDSILNENPEFQQIASELFEWKLKVAEGNWNKASEDLKRVFAPAVTVTAGKTIYDITLF